MIFSHHLILYSKMLLASNMNLMRLILHIPIPASCWPEVAWSCFLTASSWQHSANPTYYNVRLSRNDDLSCLVPQAFKNNPHRQSIRLRVLLLVLLVYFMFMCHLHNAFVGCPSSAIIILLYWLYTSYTYSIAPVGVLLLVVPSCTITPVALPPDNALAGSPPAAGVSAIGISTSFTRLPRGVSATDTCTSCIRLSGGRSATGTSTSCIRLPRGILPLILLLPASVCRGLFLLPILLHPASVCRGDFLLLVLLLPASVCYWYFYFLHPPTPRGVHAICRRDVLLLDTSTSCIRLPRGVLLLVGMFCYDTSTSCIYLPRGVLLLVPLLPASVSRGVFYYWYFYLLHPSAAELFCYRYSYFLHPICHLSANNGLYLLLRLTTVELTLSTTVKMVHLSTYNAASFSAAGCTPATSTTLLACSPSAAECSATSTLDEFLQSVYNWVFCWLLPPPLLRRVFPLLITPTFCREYTCPDNAHSLLQGCTTVWTNTVDFLQKVHLSQQRPAASVTLLDPLDKFLQIHNCQVTTTSRPCRQSTCRGCYALTVVLNNCTSYHHLSPLQAVQLPRVFYCSPRLPPSRQRPCRRSICCGVLPLI